jgi:hypothetical protein
MSYIKLGQEFNYHGPAFPFTERNADGSYYYGHEGMTLRDWFAGQALAGQLSIPTEHATADEFAKSSYQMADAMLKAREVKL